MHGLFLRHKLVRVGTGATKVRQQWQTVGRGVRKRRVAVDTVRSGDLVRKPEVMGSLIEVMDRLMVAILEDGKWMIEIWRVAVEWRCQRR